MKDHHGHPHDHAHGQAGEARPLRSPPQYEHTPATWRPATRARAWAGTPATTRTWLRTSGGGSGCRSS